jgi:GT2 family glycosyltransferase/glycosyltransferase involved in cell wall biosynthesis
MSSFSRRRQENGDARQAVGPLAEQGPLRAQGAARQREQIAHEGKQILGSPPWAATALVQALIRRARRPVLLDHARHLLAEPQVVSRYKLARRKAAVRRKTQVTLDAFLASGGRIALRHATSPDISIILVLFNQAPLTLKCLQAITSNAQLAIEVLIVDNASTDQTSALLDRVDGARIIRNAENRQFVYGVNQAAKLASGRALLLLNNDAFIRGGSLEAAWSTLFSRPEIGAVGGPLLLPNGKLQEAGSIVWNDGSCSGYGRGCNPDAPAFRFAREVDFCSGAFLLIRRSVFEALDGLDEAFAPAYYEEVDLCMRMREAGWQVWFEPGAIADHFEFASSPSTRQALSLQEQHLALFVQRHRALLGMEHAPPGSSELCARMRGRFRGRLLMVEDRVPFPSLGTGYPRSARLLRQLITEGWFVTLYPLVFPDDDWAEIRAQFPPDLEVMVGLGEGGLKRFLKERAKFYDAVLVARPHNMRSFLRASNHNSSGLRLLYDAEAIFADRQMARLAIGGSPPTEARRRHLFEAEIRLARAADTVIAVTDRDANLFRAHGCPDVRVLGHAVPLAPTDTPFSRRADLLFVGALDDDRSPNVDALVWFISQIMPHLDVLVGRDYRLIVAGRSTAKRVLKLAEPRVRLLGRLEDLTPLYASARLFIAPTRFAAGIPLKLQEAASRGLPIVATSLLAAQLGWEDERELLVADTADAFAAACARLYRDSALWQRLRDAALAQVSVDCDEQRFAQKLCAIMQSETARLLRTIRPSTQRRPPSFRFQHTELRPLVAAAWRRWRANGWRDVIKKTVAELRERLHGSYNSWIRLYDEIRPADESAIAAHIAALPEHPTFALTMIVDRSVQPREIRASLDSVSGQIYPHWEVRLLDRGGAPELRDVLDRYSAGDQRMHVLPCDPDDSDAAAINSAIACTDAELVATLAPGDQLRQHTLYMLALAYIADPDMGVVYADEDTAAEGGRDRSDPLFKPSWSPELPLQPQTIGRFVVMRRRAVMDAGGYRGELQPVMEFDMLLRIVDAQQQARVGHLSHVLHHRADRGSALAGSPLRRMVAEHLDRVREPGDIAIEDGVLRVAYHLPDPPPVSIIIPTRDQPILLRQCVAGLLESTDYPQLEVVIVDNDSRDPEACRVLRELAKDPRVRVIPYRQPFNYSAMNNLAVADARGEIVALLNDDIAVGDGGWLREMAAHALRAGVGAVGAKLCYPDGTIQHAGVVTGMRGVAGHPFRRASREMSGPAGRLKYPQTVSCVTGACMVLRRAVFQEVGGMDEANLPIAYNDVDLCLRLGEQGYRTVWTPWAELEHCESATRGADRERRNAARARAEVEYMWRRWGAVLRNDPFYNPNLTLSSENVGLAFPPRVAVPWAAYLRHSRDTRVR